MTELARSGLLIVGLAATAILNSAPSSAADAEAPQSFDREKVQSKLFDIRNSANQDKGPKNPTAAPAAPEKVNLCKVNPNLPQCK